MRAAIHTGIHERAGSFDDLDPDADDETLERQIDDAMAPMELRTLRLAWVTDDPLPHVDSPYVCFRASAAASTSLPADAVARLLDDDENLVRITMAKTSPHLVDPATAERIERRYRPGDKFTMWWDDARVLSFPPEMLRRFVTDSAPRMRSLAPLDPGLPPGLAAQLAIDPESRVRRAIAAHPNLPLRDLVRLLADEAEWVAHAAAGSPNLSPDQMDRLLALAGL